jgi:inositol transport system substrate-binding protein
MKRKILAFLIVLAIAAGLAACQATTEPSNGTPAAASPESDAAQTASAEVKPETAGGGSGIVVGFLKKSLSNVFEVKLNDAADAYLEQMKNDGVIADYVSLDCDSDPARQISQAGDLVNMKVNAALMLPAEADGSAPALQALSDAGIPTVIVNASTSNTKDLAASFVGSNDVKAGEIMGQFVLDTCGAEGQYCHLQGILGNSAAQQRGQGIHNIMDKAPGWKLLAEASAEWSGDKANKFTQDWIALYGKDIKAIICDNDEMSVAARMACIELGREDIVVIGVDAIDSALSMVKSGELHGTVFQDAEGQGKIAATAAVDLATGKTVEKEQWIDFILITSENIDQYYKK